MSTIKSLDYFFHVVAYEFIGLVLLSPMVVVVLAINMVGEHSSLEWATQGVVVALALLSMVWCFWGSPTLAHRAAQIRMAEVDSFIDSYFIAWAQWKAELALLPIFGRLFKGG
jgi:hypothetical protein